MSGTADWAGEEDILPHVYKPGDLWLGYYLRPTAEAAALIDRLEAFEVALLGHANLEPAWRDQQIDTARLYRERLSRTDRIEIGLRDDRHAVTQAGSRGGKGTTAIVNNLCLYPGSVICIDPKGENTRLCRNRRGKGSVHCDGLGQSVAVLDPYCVSGTPPEELSAWNPVDGLRLDDPQLIDRAAGIADSLFIRTKAEDAHFDDSARIFVKALILFVAYEYAGRDDRNLITVYDLLMNGAVAQLEADRAAASAETDTSGITPFDYLLELMLCDLELADGVVAGAANMLLGMGDRERGGVLSTARRNLEFLERKGIRQALRCSTFDLDAIKTDPKGLTIFLCLPPQRMHDTARFMRLMIGASLERMYEIETPPATGHPVLFLLEEFASLRNMDIIEHAAGYAAGFGIKIWIIVQDITQMKRNYKDGWETFIGNAGVIQAFANSDYTTLDYLSKKIGQTEITQTVKNINTTRTASSSKPSDHQRARSAMSLRDAVASLFDAKATTESASMSASDSEQIKLTALIQPDEIERMFAREQMNQLVLIKGKPPMVLARENYFEGARFLGLYDPDRKPFRTKEEARQEGQRREAERQKAAEALIREAEDWISNTVGAIAEAEQAHRKGYR